MIPLYFAYQYAGRCPASSFLNPSDGKRIVIVAQFAAEVFELTHNVFRHNIDQAPLQTDFDPPQTTRPT